MHTDDVNQRIMQAAEVEFAEHGFHQTVVSRIAARANVGKGTVYRRFGDKQSLFAQLITRGMTTLHADLHQAVSKAGDPRQGLSHILNVYFDFFDQGRDLIAITILEGVKLTSGIHAEIKRNVNLVLAEFGELFTRGIEEGYFCQADPNDLAFLFHEFIWSVLRGAVFFGYNPREKYGPRMLEIFLYGIAVQSIPKGGEHERKT